MVTNIFQLPIEYCNSKKIVTQNIHTDLECTKDKNLYDLVFNSKNKLGKKISLDWIKTYTTDKQFLKDSQHLYKHVKLNKISDKTLDYYEEYTKFKKLDKSIFLEKYQYIEFSYIRFLNNYSKVMQILSINNLLSPLLTLAIPIIIFFVPFFLIRLQNKRLDFSTYINLLKICFKRLPIGKALAGASKGKLTIDKQLSVVGSVVFYVLQIYQNYTSCRRFYKNLYFINTFIHKTSIFINSTITNIDKFLFTSNNLISYKLFNESLIHHKSILQSLYDNINHIKHFKLSVKNVSSIGYSMKYFYTLFMDDTINKSLCYFFDLNGYIDNLLGLQSNIKTNMINYCQYTKKETQFKESYFIVLPHKTTIKNSYQLNKNMLITGPNAAGKTTILKSTLFNILLSQQLGCGCYKSAKVNPYDYLHCYLNIPDTSQRDSLFQSEARRCKDILTLIEKNKDKRHFCIFDELYSGTNPYEAISTSYSYLTYLSKNKHIKFMITTHYIKLCEKLEDNKHMVNKHMEIKENNDIFTYTYKLKNDISTIKGGIKVLQDLKYPPEIIDNTKYFLKKNY